MWFRKQLAGIYNHEQKVTVSLKAVVLSWTAIINLILFLLRAVCCQLKGTSGYLVVAFKLKYFL